jgi:hypothetical protein
MVKQKNIMFYKYDDDGNLAEDIWYDASVKWNLKLKMNMTIKEGRLKLTFDGEGELRLNISIDMMAII